MRTLLAISVVTLPLLAVGACRKQPGTVITRDACSLIPKQEVESVQQTQLNDVKSSERSDGVFLVSQCFYTAAEFSKSVNLALVQTDPKQPSRRSPKDFWKEKFGPYERDGRQQTQTTENEEKQEGTAPKKIDGIGDAAYWVRNRFGGVLYVLKGEAFMSIGLGGTAEEDTKLEKSKLLARKALQRL